MYVVKLRYKDSNEICYANESVINEVKEIRKEDNSVKLDWFTMTMDKARKLVNELISRNSQAATINYGWGGGDTKKLDFISIVELSNYDSKREYQVIDYKEFK